MKLINKLITNSAIYKHLNELYIQVIKENEVLQYKIKEANINIDFYKKSFENTTKSYIELSDLFDRLNNNIKETNKYQTKQIKKIRMLVNKLDKKDINVKSIKQLIKGLE